MAATASAMQLIGTSENYRGYKLPSFKGIVETVSALQTFKPSDKDILLCSYPKTGSHWMFEILNMLQNYSTEYSSVRINNIESMPHLLTPSQEPRILHTHLSCDLLPSYFETNSKIVYVMRNPKDQFVSMYHMYTSLQWSKEQTFNHFFDTVMSNIDEVEYGFWTRNVLVWWFTHISNPNVLFILYEDMIQDLSHEVEKVNKFFGFNREPSFVEAVASKTKFRTMKSEKPNLEWYSCCKDGFNILRQGKTNSWQSLFSQTQSMRFDKLLRSEYQRLLPRHKLVKPMPYFTQILYSHEVEKKYKEVQDNGNQSVSCVIVS